MGHLFILHQAWCIISNPSVTSNSSYSPETLNSGQNWWLFCPAWPWNLMDDLAKQQGTSSIYYIKLCASFQSPGWTQTGATIRKRSIRVKMGNFCPFDFEIWQMPLKNNRAPFLCGFKLCVSFHNHWWIQTGVTVRKRPIWVKIDDFFAPSVLKIWRMTLKNNRAPLLRCFKLCASFHSQWWIQTGVPVR